MRVLAFDTCLDACSAAVWDADRGTMHGRCEHMQQGHAERLCPMIEEVLAEAGMSLASIDAVAVTLGPGTFTGIRIGIAAARGFALAAQAKVLGATSLSLLAATTRAALDESRRVTPIAACHDARKGEVLIEILRADHRASIYHPRLMPPAEAAALIAAQAPDAILCGSGASAIAAAAADAGASPLQLAPPGIQPDARHMRDLNLVPVAKPSPLYPRPPDARPPASPSLARMP